MAYSAQQLWVDTEEYLPHRAENYVLSGRLLKTLEVRRAIMRDTMKKNPSTEFRVERVKLDEPPPKNIFSLEALSCCSRPRCRWQAGFALPSERPGCHGEMASCSTR